MVYFFCQVRGMPSFPKSHNSMIPRAPQEGGLLAAFHDPQGKETGLN